MIIFILVFFSLWGKHHLLPPSCAHLNTISIFLRLALKRSLFLLSSTSTTFRAFPSPAPSFPSCPVGITLKLPRRAAHFPHTRPSLWRRRFMRFGHAAGSRLCVVACVQRE